MNRLPAADGWLGCNGLVALLAGAFLLGATLGLSRKN